MCGVRSWIPVFSARKHQYEREKKYSLLVIVDRQLSQYFDNYSVAKHFHRVLIRQICRWYLAWRAW